MTAMFYEMEVRLTDGYELHKQFGTMAECIEMKDRLIEGTKAVSWGNTWINPRNVVTVEIVSLL